MSVYKFGIYLWADNERERVHEFGVYYGLIMGEREFINWEYIIT